MGAEYIVFLLLEDSNTGVGLHRRKHAAERSF
jgi:hypothetical protein